MEKVKNYFRLIAEDQDSGGLAHLLKPFLSGASLIYEGGVSFLQGLYQKGWLTRKRLPFPVISVGNLTWGGTGKTPLVEYLARRVLEREKIPLVLTRGYGADEFKQLRAHLPRARIGVGKERYEAARRISSQGPPPILRARAESQERIDVAILDDGFQHWRLMRDIEIVTVNALNPFGNGRLFPRGILREPQRALRRASVIVLSHVNLVKPEELSRLREQILRFAPSSFLVESYLEPLFFYRARGRTRLSLHQLGNRRVATFSAVASPRSFQLLLAWHGIKPVRNFEYCDHHTFSRKELEEIRQVSKKGEVDEIVTTEKDFYRSPEAIAEILDPWILATRLQISAGEEILTDRLFRLLGVG